MAGKVYYTIGEVAQMFNVNTSLIRFWEKEFDIIKPQKNKKGNRLFTRADLENFRIIYHLVKEKGFTLQGAREHLRANKQEIEKELLVVKTLSELRGFLLEMKEQLDKPGDSEDQE